MSVSAGCTGVAAGDADPVDAIYGRRGYSNGRFLKPRAITIDSDDRVFIVDTTGRIQRFTAEGDFETGWTIPDTANGRPTGLGVRRIDGVDHLLVADTHYYRVLTYTAEGELVQRHTIGGNSGILPGEFAFVTDAVGTAGGGVIAGEYNAADRIQRFDVEGTPVDAWGSTGDRPNEFLRPQGLAIRENVLYVADASNHRIQRFDLSESPPRLIDIWGGPGKGAGQFAYPYGLDFLPDGRLVVAEYENARVQLFDVDGEFAGVWGRPGRESGELNQPWGVAVDSRSRIHVLDSHNHRVQRFLPSAFRTEIHVT